MLEWPLKIRSTAYVSFHESQSHLSHLDPINFPISEFKIHGSAVGKEQCILHPIPTPLPLGHSTPPVKAVRYGSHGGTSCTNNVEAGHENCANPMKKKTL